MHIKINRTISDPPPRDYSRRDSIEAKAERGKILTALQSIEPGQSVYFTGLNVKRDRINSLLSTLQRRGHTANYATANIPGGIGVWRTS